MSGDLLTTREAAALLGVGTTSIKRWADSGLLRCVKTPGGHRRFPRDAVQALMGASLPVEPRSSDWSADWLAWLVSGSSPARGAAQVTDRLTSERRERGSWLAVAEAMGPVLDELGEAWARGDISVIQEHIAAEHLARGIARCCEGVELPAGAPACFLLTAEHDEHTLGLGLLELCLREAGWSGIWSGSKTPILFACEFITANSIAMVGVSASRYSRDASLMADQAQRLGEACRQRGIPLLLGGYGEWPEEPPYGHRLRTFSEMRRLIDGPSSHRSQRCG